MQVGPEHNGAALTVVVGEVITVELPENPTTGFQWRLEGNTDDVRIIGDRSLVPGEAMGAPSVHRFELRPTRPGVAALRWVKERAWEGKPTDEFAVTLNVGRSDLGPT